MTAPPRLRVDAVSRSFPGVKALDRVSFEIASGTVHALVGENGAGKSTLVKLLGGAIQPDEGRFLLDGRPAPIRTTRDAQALGIAVVHQELQLIDDLTVSENMFLGRWPGTRFGVLGFRELHRRAEDMLSSLSIDLPVQRRVAGLSVAHRQMIEIARALSLSARLLILDEPSAVLTPHELETLFQVIRQLARDGSSVLYISHRLDEVFAIADTVTVLKDGKHVSTRPVAETARDRLIREMVGRDVGDEFPLRAAPIGRCVLRVDGLTSPGRFRDVSFEIASGEVLALTGLVGAGRTSVARAIFGAARVSRGRVNVGPFTGPFRGPKQARRAGVAHIPEDRKQQGLLLRRSVRENMSLAHLHDVSTLGILRPARERRVVERMIGEFQIRAAGTEVPVATLSGGNQQKVMLARWLQRPCALVLLDEPTRGVDVAARSEIYGWINRMAADGAAVLLVTSELLEAIGMADRIAVMCRGRLTGVLDNRNRDVSEEQVLRLAMESADSES